MSPTPGMAVEVFLGEAIPNVNTSLPSLTSNSNIQNTPPATTSIVVPESPSGVDSGQFTITSPSTGTIQTYAKSPAEFNYHNTITSTQEMLENILGVESSQQGVAALTSVPTLNNVLLALSQWNGSLGGFVPTWAGYGTAGTKFS